VPHGAFLHLRSMPQWLWKVAQLAVFGGLVVVFHELDRNIPILAAVVVALAATALIFTPLIHLQYWLLRRRLRSDHSGTDKRLN
jgi:hypothetical protein